MTKSELLALGGLQTRTGANLREIGLAALEAAEATGRAQKTQPASPMPRKRYVAGIDPGVKTGFSVWDREAKEFKCVETMDFWTVYRGLTCGFMYSAANTVVIIEVAHHAPVFRERKAKGLNENHAARLAQNVGQVMREAKLLAEGLRRCGYEVIEQKPLGKKGKAADDRAEFERVTGWTKQTSQHARDAARMAFQR
jgi:predicted nuclease with RNAse H fold